MSRHLAALALAAPVAAWAAAPPPRQAQPSYRLDQAPERMAAGIRAAESAITALQGRLSARLMEVLRAGGPSRAVAVCRDEAQLLAKEVGDLEGVRVGRTSHRLRNPGNAAPPWAERHVAASGETAAVEPLAVDLGDRVGVLRPVVTAAPCLTCHGPAERLPAEVKAVLATAYPDDRAVGFEEGSLRGFLWAEAPLAQVASPPPQDARAWGERLFGEANPRCTVCHPVAGKGNPQGRPLDGVGKRLGRDEIKAWLRTPADMARKHGRTRKPPMVPYPEFTDEELEALVTYLLSLEERPQRD